MMRRDISAWLKKEKGDKSMEALFESFVRYMQEEKCIGIKDIIGDLSVPISIFAAGLSPSEALCKYLKERNHPFRRIGCLINRDERSVWTSYQRANAKHPNTLFVDEEGLHIPVSLFADRRMSILEHVVSFTLTKTGMSVPALARTLNKHPSAMHTVVTRARQKQEERFIMEGGA